MKPRIRTRSLLGLAILMAAAQLLTSSGLAAAGTRNAFPADESPAASQIMPVTSCSALARIDVTNGPDAPGTR